MSESLECRITFNGRLDTLALIKEYIQNRHSDIRADFQEMEHWSSMPQLAKAIAHDHLFVVITARKGTVSFKNALERLPEEITKYFSGKNLMIIFPDQFGNTLDEMTFAQPQHTEELSAYDMLRNWLNKKTHA